MTNILTRIDEIVHGRTILAIPDEIEFLKRSDYLRLLSHSTLHRTKIRLLENLVLTWKTQIQSAIDDDRDPIDQSPRAEIDFWISRTENLQAIQRQVSSIFDERFFIMNDKSRRVFNKSICSLRYEEHDDKRPLMSKNTVPYTAI